MTIGDLLFLLTVMLTIGALASLGFAAVRRRFARVRRILAVLSRYLGIYALVLIGVSLVSPQRVIPPQEKQCFDEWCVAVASLLQTTTLGTAPTVATAGGTFRIVTIAVSSRAQRQRQRETDASIWLIDANGNRYPQSRDGQQGLDTLGRGGSPLDTFLSPGEAFTHVVVFDVPDASRITGVTITHRWFPSVLIIGDGQSFLHKPTLLQFPQ